MEYICPLIIVEDIKKSTKFYKDILNQKIKIDFGENVTFEGDFAIHQKKHFQSLINNNEIIQKSNSFELYFEDDDLQQIVDKLKNNDIEFVHDLKEQPWRQLVVRFYDYDKNMIEIGERMEHVAYRLHLENLSIQEISQITYLPEEIVITAISDYKSKS